MNKEEMMDVIGDKIRDSIDNSRYNNLVDTRISSSYYDEYVGRITVESKYFSGRRIVVKSDKDYIRAYFVGKKEAVLKEFHYSLVTNPECIALCVMAMIEEYFNESDLYEDQEILDVSTLIRMDMHDCTIPNRVEYNGPNNVSIYTPFFLYHITGINRDNHKRGVYILSIQSRIGPDKYRRQKLGVAHQLQAGYLKQFIKTENNYNWIYDEAVSTNERNQPVEDDVE